jgi:hypothetical protein
MTIQAADFELSSKFAARESWNALWHKINRLRLHSSEMTLYVFLEVGTAHVLHSLVSPPGRRDAGPTNGLQNDDTFSFFVA